jgi:hypothetical protein
MQVNKVKISEVKGNPKNPRLIKDDKFKKLVKSIQEFPQMLELRPIVVDENNIVLGGNMRLKACKEAGLKEVYIVKAEGLTELQKDEFIVKDNVGFGEWDWDMLANEWDTKLLDKWGLDLPVKEINDQEEIYTTKIESPIYTPKGDKPKLQELYNKSNCENLIKEIDKSELDISEKEFLKIAAYRHIEFNYKNIAEYYAHSSDKFKELAESSALVIIDYDKAIELGFVKLYNTLENLAQIDE